MLDSEYIFPLAVGIVVVVVVAVGEIRRWRAAGQSRQSRSVSGYGVEEPRVRCKGAHPMTETSLSNAKCTFIFLIANLIRSDQSGTPVHGPSATQHGHGWQRHRSPSVPLSFLTSTDTRAAALVPLQPRDLLPANSPSSGVTL